MMKVLQCVVVVVCLVVDCRCLNEYVIHVCVMCILISFCSFCEQGSWVCWCSSHRSSGPLDIGTLDRA